MRVKSCVSYNGADIIRATVRNTVPGAQSLSQLLNEEKHVTVFRAKKYTVEEIVFESSHPCAKDEPAACASLRSKVTEKIVTARESSDVLDMIIFEIDNNVKLQDSTARIQVVFWLFLAPMEMDDDVHPLETLDPDSLC